MGKLERQVRERAQKIRDARLQKLLDRIAGATAQALRDAELEARAKRQRILKHAIQSLADSGIGVGASFVRNIVKNTGEGVRP